MPELIARVREYRTDQGDIWDVVALRCYGVEQAMSTVIEGNYDYRFTDAFPANVRLNIPGRAKLEFDLRVQPQVPDIKTLLPWR